MTPTLSWAVGILPIIETALDILRNRKVAVRFRNGWRHESGYEQKEIA